MVMVLVCVDEKIPPPIFTYFPTRARMGKYVELHVLIYASMANGAFMASTDALRAGTGGEPWV